MVREQSEFFIRGTNMKVDWVADMITGGMWLYGRSTELKVKAKGRNRTLRFAGEIIAV